MKMVWMGVVAAVCGVRAAENPFAAARWIGEGGENELTWREEDAKKARGITGAQGHAWIISNRVEKTCCRLRRTFALSDRPLRRATVHVSGMGFYELWVNGAKADPRRVLAPGMTSGGKVLGDVYDVTEQLKPGVRNTLGLWLAPGYSDDFSRYGWHWLAPKRAILRLDVAYADGSAEVLVSDGAWESTTRTPILAASIYHGEVYDAACEDAAWATATGAAEGWRPVRVFPDGPSVRMNDAPPVRLGDVRRPVSIAETEPGVYTVDFGQNRAGVVRLRAKGPKGTRITVQTSELLGANGRIDPWTNRRAKSTDTFILAGTGKEEEFTPRFTYHGFQFAEIRGWPGKLTAADVASVAIHADLKPTSTFRCSDETLMKLHNAATWSMLSNFVSFPTDCCMRDERTPCRMDSQAYEDAACQFFDMRSYYAKWLGDAGFSVRGNPDWTGDDHSLPFRLWLYYGLEAFPMERYAAAKKYVDTMLAEHPDCLFKEGYGDWCAPNDGTWQGYHNDVEVVNTALFCHILDRIVAFARETGRDDDAAAYGARLAAAKAAFHAAYYHPETATYGDGSQVNSILPLAFGLVPENCRAAVGAGLVRRIREKDGGKYDVGIYGNRYIGDVLCELGESDLLLDMVTQTEYPGFGNMFKLGATTLWEQWAFKGYMHSHNHAMMSGGTSWLYTHLAGIRPAKPGYAAVLIKPVFPKRIAFVEATRLTPQGEIRVAWTREGDAIRVKATVPPSVPSVLELAGRRREFQGTVETLVR